METEKTVQVANTQFPNFSKYLNQTTIHIAIEVVMALLMFTYFNSKISNLENKIKNTQCGDFEERISVLEKQLAKQEKLIAKLCEKRVTFEDDERRSNPLLDTISNFMNIGSGKMGRQEDEGEIHEVDNDQLDEELKEMGEIEN